MVLAGWASRSRPFIGHMHVAGNRLWQAKARRMFSMFDQHRSLHTSSTRESIQLVGICVASLLAVYVCLAAVSVYVVWICLCAFIFYAVVVYADAKVKRRSCAGPTVNF